MSATCRLYSRWIVCLAIVVCPSSLAAAETAGWKAGTAQVVITPQQSMWMAGYAARERPSEGTLAELRAKTLVLEDAAGRLAVLVTLDLVGIDRELTQSICSRVAEKHGIQREQIALCASHTHSGPALVDNLAPLHYRVLDNQQQQKIAQYTGRLQEQLVELVGQALAHRFPATLSWGSGSASFAVNRRNNRADAVPQLRAEGRLLGPADHDVPVLTVRDAQDQLKAIVFGYACHATVLSIHRWSGDYPGFAQLEIEQAHPGCQAMFWAGCGADQNPLPRGTEQLARDYGQQLAQAVEQTLDELHPLEPRLRTAYREIALPLADLPSREAIVAASQSGNRYEAARAAMLLEQIQRDGQLSASYPYPVQTWQLGDEIQFAMLGGEVVVDFSLRLKSELQGIRTWVAAYSNDVMAYIASRRVLAEGGYEGGSAMVYYGLPGRWAPESEDLIIAEVGRQLTPEIGDRR